MSNFYSKRRFYSLLAIIATMQNIIKKLDLIDYIESFSQLMAREKSIILEGDINLHYKLINELSKFDIKAPNKI